MRQDASQFILRSAALSACAAAIVSLSGCSGFSGNASPGSTTSPPVPSTAAIPKGLLRGGQQPIVNAHVYVYAANNTGGYGSASQSLMQPGTGTAIDPSLNNYVTTGADGSFSYAGTVTCPTPTTQVYLLALGGNNGGNQPAADNTAITLMASLGNCSSINASTFTNISEVTTAAMAYGLQAFTIDPTHIGTPASNTAGLLTAFKTVANLADSTTGNALAATPTGNGVAPQATLNALGNIVSTCVNSISSTSAACSSLFSHVSSTLSGTPTTVFGALLNIASFPGSQVANLYSDSLQTAPFQPALITQPNDFSLGITFSPTAITAVQPSAVVIDRAGNIWMANCQSCLNPSAPDSLLEFSPNGVFLHSFTGSAVPSIRVLHGIKGIALDANGTNIYTINQGIPGGPTPGVGDDQMIKMDTATGTVQAGFPIDFSQGTYGVDTFNGIAVDNSGELWATATNTGAVIQATPGGNLINGSPFFIGGTLGVATDNIGNIWFAGIGGNNILEFDTNGDFLQNFTPAGLNQPVNIAVNASNELWTINQASQSLSKIEFFNGANGSGSPYSNVGIFQASVVAIDGDNQVVIPNCRASCPSSGSNQPDNLLRFAQTGDPNTGGSSANFGAAVPTFSGPSGAAIDASGNVWVSNNISGTLTQVIGFAAPTIQPLALASSNGQIGQLP
jgi:hypothetical protein